MTLFAIIEQPGDNGTKLGGAIAATYPDSFYYLGDGAWLVSDSATAKDVSDKLSVTGGENGAAVVVEIASYFGRANPAIWSWMKAKWEHPPVG